MTNSRIKKGFTLIELLVVIAIIGVLASVVLASLNTARRKSRDARRVSDIKQIQMALELYFDGDGDGEYPDASASLAPKYIATVATDPSTNAAYPYTNLSLDGSGNRVACAVASGTCTFYHLGALLEGDADSGPLKGDRDLNAVVDGGPDGGTASAACAEDSTAFAAGTDKCFDVTP